MKYLVIGAGGTGGAIAGFMSKAGKDVTVIARGRHLAAMRQDGLHFETPTGAYTVPVKACTMEEYAARDEVADVIFVCVKGYSLEETVSFIAKIADSHSVVIPILNIYGTGRKMQEQLPQLHVTDGCIYIASQIKEPGTILMSGTIFRIVFGLRKDADATLHTLLHPVLSQVEKDLAEAGITPLYSKQIEKDALQKFSFVSPMAAAGAAYEITAKDMQAGGAYENTYISLVQEIKLLSDAMDVSLPEDIVDINKKIMAGLAPDATASMQRDILDGKASEVDGLVYEVVRLGEAFGVELPTYRAVSEKLRALLAE
ncbi:MAG: 2-dehydropantoate 2-reductase [Lachnospiraceae bacterium]|nr:2-dehydropantoate 2-reductase [Lachnospiraceae bacterium]